MIKRKIKSILNDFSAILNKNKNHNKTTVNLLKEIEWAHIYHDSIRDNDELQKLSLKIGRWAGNYSFFFIVHRVLKDFRPRKIVEFGLGESSKFISRFNFSTGDKHEHIVIEHDDNWIKIFNESFDSKNIKFQHHPLIQKSHNRYEYNGYDNLESIPDDADLYIIDGPFGTPKYSRYDIFHVLNRIKHDKDFVLILDDYNRIGEKETADEIIEMFKRKSKTVYIQKFEGGKSQFVLVTEKYKYLLTV